MKRHWCCILPFLMLALGLSCSNSAIAKNDAIALPHNIKYQNVIEFSEVRRLNKDIALKETLVLTKFSETLDLYSKLQDKRFSRSEPIPTLYGDEFFVVVKPKLKKKQYGDIEVVKIEEDQSILTVFYKEIDNHEYLLNKEKNPILILRVKGNIPKGVKLASYND